MVALNTPIADFDSKAPDFSLKNVDGTTISRDDVMGENGLIVMFICNHCPFVKSIVSDLISDIKQLQKLGIGACAIMSNDVVAYPDDNPQNMKTFASQNGFTFPYLYDEDQKTAKDYGAVCTPDFFGYNHNMLLKYRGRLDGAGMQKTPGLPREMVKFMTEVIETGTCGRDQTPSIGCSIKWKE